MAKGIDLELLRSMLQSFDVHVAQGIITKVQVADDLSAVYVNCTLQPEGRQVVAQMTWDSVGAGSGSGDLPEINDAVIVCFCDREPDDCFVLRRISTREEKLPAPMKDGHYVTQAKPGKKLILGSTTKVEVGKGTGNATEPLVLGAVNIAFMTNLLDAFLNAAQIGIHPLGPVFLDPGIRTLLVQYKSTYLTTAATNIASQIAFTERGN